MPTLSGSILLSLIVAVSTVSAAETRDYTFLDTHVHVEFSPSGESGKYLEAYHELGFAKKAILISPSYNVKSENKFMNDLETALLADRKTSELTQQSPDRLVGLCGLRWKFNGADSVAKKCLELPGMKGVKLRYFPTESMVPSIQMITKVLTDTAHVKIVLMHFPLSIESVEGRPLNTNDLQNIEELTKLAKKFPSTNWIMAHSFYSPELVSAIAKKGLGNIWLEPSTLVSFLPRENAARILRLNQYAEAWRKFGIERILFGSDASIDEWPDYLELKNAWPFDNFKAVQTAKDDFDLLPLSREEKNKILNDNGRVFWELIQ